MANQRKAGKKCKTLWLSPAEKKALVILSVKAKMNEGDFLKRELTQYLKDHPELEK